MAKTLESGSKVYVEMIDWIEGTLRRVDGDTAVVKVGNDPGAPNKFPLSAIRTSLPNDKPKVPPKPLYIALAGFVVGGLITGILQAVGGQLWAAYGAPLLALAWH